MSTTRRAPPCARGRARTRRCRWSRWGLRARRAHHDLLAQGSGLEDQVEPGLVRADRRAVRTHGRQARRLRRNRVRAVREGRLVAALGVGEQRAGALGAAHREQHVRQRDAVGGVDVSEERSLLGERGPGHEGGQHEGETKHDETPLATTRSARRERRVSVEEAPGARGPQLLHARSPTDRSVRAGFLASGSTLRSLTFPGLAAEWRRLTAPLVGTGSPATVAGPRRLPTCFPITPRNGGTLTCRATVTQRAPACQARRRPFALAGEAIGGDREPRPIDPRERGLLVGGEAQLACGRVRVLEQSFASARVHVQTREHGFGHAAAARVRARDPYRLLVTLLTSARAQRRTGTVQLRQQVRDRRIVPVALERSTVSGWLRPPAQLAQQLEHGVGHGVQVVVEDAARPPRPSISRPPARWTARTRSIGTASQERDRLEAEVGRVRMQVVQVQQQVGAGGAERRGRPVASSCRSPGGSSSVATFSSSGAVPTTRRARIDVAPRCPRPCPRMRGGAARCPISRPPPRTNARCSDQTPAATSCDQARHVRRAVGGRRARSRRGPATRRAAPAAPAGRACAARAARDACPRSGRRRSPRPRRCGRRSPGCRRPAPAASPARRGRRQLPHPPHPPPHPPPHDDPQQDDPQELELDQDASPPSLGALGNISRAKLHCQGSESIPNTAASSSASSAASRPSWLARARRRAKSVRRSASVASPRAVRAPLRDLCGRHRGDDREEDQEARRCRARARARTGSW